MSKILERVKGWVHQWKKNWDDSTDRINEYNRAVCLQRDAEYKEFLIWKGIVK